MSTRAPTYEGLRAGLALIARARGEWAGLPVPLDGQEMIVEKTFPHAEVFRGPAREVVDARDDGIVIRNRFWSTRHRIEIIVWGGGERGAKIGCAFHAAPSRLDRALQTAACLPAWDMGAEGVALELLRGLLSEPQFKCYIFTGFFIETSRRSGARYVFRRSRPTLALADGRVVAALCMHPIGYYAGTWAGVMVPTDDVLAHLALMRGDERLFWARCNQHAPHRPEADV